MSEASDRRIHEVLLAEPRGFCAGVDRAIEIVERAIRRLRRAIYVRHEIVHNTYVVNDLKAKVRSSCRDTAEVPPAPRCVQRMASAARCAKKADARGFQVF